MEAIYWVMSWLCHRRCVHCYEDRFRPYAGDELQQVVEEARACFPKIIENLPRRMTFLDLADAAADGRLREKQGRIILAGGEILLQPVREAVLYPAIEKLREKYRDEGGIELIVQTTGDVITARHVQELLGRQVDRISVSGMDAYHEGLEPEQARAALQQKLTRMFEAHGMEQSEDFRALPIGDEARRPTFSFFGATPDSWIGSIWPRGRAQENELSSATLAENFCNRWSGGLNFLQYRHSGSEVSIEPNGNVYPCCIKTKAPVGNLTQEPLESILDRHVGNPVYEAISMGHPERMGIQHGWSVEKFLEKSKMALPSGRIYQNLCIGCDRFHEEVLMKQSELVTINAGNRI